MSVRTFPEPLRVAGVPLLVETSSRLPLVDVVLTFRSGSLADPEGLDGVARVAARACRMGTGTLSALELEERIASLGARLAIDVGTTHVRFHGAVVSRNLEPFFALLRSLILEPAFRAADIAKVKREFLADLDASLDDDRYLAGRAFRRALFGDHPFARSIGGDLRSMRAVRRADVIDAHARLLARDRLLVGFAGDVKEDAAIRMVRSLVDRLPSRAPKTPLPPATRARKGLTFVVVDKPDRTQCQLIAGTLGLARGDEHLFPLHVANTAFGGMFSGRLMNEVRVKRGYSYGAGSRIGVDVRRDAWTMSTFPTAAHLVDCAALMLELHEAWVEKGLRRDELALAKSCLVNGRCFEDDTPGKRLDARLDVLQYELPVAHYVEHDRLVEAVRGVDVRNALRARISTRDRAVSMVGDARTLVPALRARFPRADVRTVKPRGIARGDGLERALA